MRVQVPAMDGSAPPRPVMSCLVILVRYVPSGMTGRVAGATDDVADGLTDRGALVVTEVVTVEPVRPAVPPSGEAHDVARQVPKAMVAWIATRFMRCSSDTLQAIPLECRFSQPSVTVLAR